MADLKKQLGDSQMAYMNVKISYSHSAFSDYFGHEILVGVSQRCTRLETTAVGALKLHYVGSAWSPAPAYSTHILKGIMQRHWSHDVVSEWLERIRVSRKLVGECARQERAASTVMAQQARPQTPVYRPSMSVEDMRQPRPVHRISDPREAISRCSHIYGRRDACEAQRPQNMGSLGTRRSWSRNSSATTYTAGSLNKKKSFAAGIWRSLTLSTNTSKADGEGQGAWNWNSWF